MVKRNEPSKSERINTHAGAAPAVPSVRARRGTERHRQAATRRRRPWLLGAVAVVALLVIVGSFSLMRDEENDANGASAIANLDAPDVHSLVVNPGDPEHVLFGSHAGVQESYDGGFNWEPGSLKNADAMQLASSPNAPETLYATGHDVFQVSHDGGNTWQALDHDLPGTDIHGFTQNPVDPQRLYAYVAGIGVFMSADSGTTWKPLSTQPLGGGMHLALASSGEILYAASETGIMASPNDGAAWELLAAQPEGSIISLAVAASDPSTLYAGTHDGLVQSTDGGANWSARGPMGVPAVALAVTPSDPSRVLFASDEGAVYRSDDGGLTWLSPH